MPLPLPVEPPAPRSPATAARSPTASTTPRRRSSRRSTRAARTALVDRLEEAARQKHGAAHRDAYRAYREEVEHALADGRRHGLVGADLLDYFYLVHRLAYRSGLGARSGRYSACATPAFVRAAFDLTPEQRLDGRLHTELINRLVPAWSEVPFFEPNDAGPSRRSAARGSGRSPGTPKRSRR